MSFKLRFTAIMLMLGTFAFSGCKCGDDDGTIPITPTTDTEAVTTDAAVLDSDDITFTGSDMPSSVTGNFILPTSGSSGTTITWAEKTDTGNNIVLSGTGNSIATVTWPEASGFGPYTVELTATISKGSEYTTKDISVTVYPLTTTKVATTADSVTIKMVLAPGGLTFPTGVDDDGSASVANAYWIGETEVTYELWDKVYDWAVNGTGNTTGEGQYTFKNAGVMGDGTGDTNQHPVTTVNWRDSMVWCNALTEWYNAQKGTSYECVYTYSSAIIRDSQDSNDTACDGAEASSTAKGFRLLTINEYGLAARYRDGTLWTYGDHVSGDDSGACYNDGSILGGLGMSTVFGNYAVYDDNSGSSAAVVKSLGDDSDNALGIFDMSGSVYEWCFDLSGAYRVRRGGSWSSSSGYTLRIGRLSENAPTVDHNNTGFRFARTQ